VSILKNRHSGALVEQHVQSFVSKKELLEGRAGYKQRMDKYTEDMNVVRVLDHESAGSTKLCSTFFSEYVYIERMSRRLPDLGKLGEEHILYIIHEALNGVGHIVREEGTAEFFIHESMIGINSEDIVKVWFNDNFAKNSPASSTLGNKDLMKANMEDQLIEEIFQIGRKHSQDKSFSPKFQAALNNQPRPYQFGPCIQLIKNYCVANY
jgi:hypothetical protein